jgi:hypothetical protein
LTVRSEPTCATQPASWVRNKRISSSLPVLNQTNQAI